MPSLSLTPSVHKAIRALESWLWDQHYSQHYVEQIARYMAAHGTLAGCPHLDPEDEATASEVYCEALEPVDFDSCLWSVVRGPWSVVSDAEEEPPAEPEPPYEPTAEDLADYAAWSERIRDLTSEIPPIRGGGPDLDELTADALEECRRLDQYDEIRRAEAQDGPRYGYE